MLGAILIVLVVLNAFIAGRNTVEISKMKQVTKSIAEEQAQMVAFLQEKQED